LVCRPFIHHKRTFMSNIKLSNLDLGVSHLSFNFVGAKNAHQINFVVFKYK